jgi:shikimate kinase
MRFYIVGFMGSGKTHMGKMWAAEYGFTFYDLDNMIEEVEGVSVETIFEKHGEDCFREKETAILKTTALLDNAIIACGGGTACFNNNIDWMKANGIVVFLNETEEKILKNLQKDTDERPLLKNKTIAEKKIFIENLLQERMPFYKQSHVIISTEQMHLNGFNLALYTTRK